MIEFLVGLGIILGYMVLMIPISYGAALLIEKIGHRNLKNPAAFHKGSEWRTYIRWFKWWADSLLVGFIVITLLVMIGTLCWGIGSLVVNGV